jgi:hypothetical protein
LSDLDEKLVLKEEFLGARLYTGPMFEKYNLVYRGGALQNESGAFIQVDFMKNKFKEFCKGNRYTTTIWVINSALIKHSKLTKANIVYRGITGGRLPRQFWKHDLKGRRGGVEFAFLSTTVDKNVAMQYAKTRGNSMILQIETGAVDRGAELTNLSQCPGEAEMCFPPLTNLEVLSAGVEDRLMQGSRFRQIGSGAWTGYTPRAEFCSRQRPEVRPRYRSQTNLQICTCRASSTGRSGGRFG